MSQRFLRRRGHFLPSVALLSILALLGTVVFTAPAVAAAKPKSGGTFTDLIRQNPPRALDPVLNGYNAIPGGNVFFPIFGSLAVYNRETNDLDMVMAKSIVSNDKGLTWVITIKPNIKFSDGTTYDAAAVVAQWDRVKNPSNASPSLGLVRDMTSYRASAPLTVEVVLAKQNTRWPFAFAGSAGLNAIASPTAVARLGANFGNAPIGAGPFVLKEFVRDSSLTYEKNPTYFDAPRPYLDRLVQKIILDDQQRNASFTAKGGDASLTNSPIAAKSMEAVPNTVTKVYPTDGVAGLSMNTTIAPTNDVRVREAFQLAIDLKQQASVFGVPEVGQLYSPGNPYFDKSFKYPKLNLKKAQKLIDDYVAETGKDVTILYESSQADLGMETIKAQLERLKGVHVNIKQLTFGPAYTNDIANNIVHMTYWTVIGNGSLEPVINDQFRCPATPPPSPPGPLGTNYGRYCNAQVDTMLDKIRSINDEAEQKSLYQQIQKQILLKDHAFALDAYYATWRTYTKDVKGVVGFHDGGNVRYDLLWRSTT